MQEFHYESESYPDSTVGCMRTSQLLRQLLSSNMEDQVTGCLNKCLNNWEWNQLRKITNAILSNLSTSMNTGRKL